MKSINTVSISGNLASDPEVRELGSSGKYVTSFTVAVNDDYKRAGDTEWTKQTHFIRCKAFGYTGKEIADTTRKGLPIALTGKLVQEEWEAEGKKQSKTLVEVVTFMAGAGRASNTSSGQAPEKSPGVDFAAAAKRIPVRKSDPDLDAAKDDIPF